MKQSRSFQSAFVADAEAVLALPVDHRVHALGGYGPGGEAIYTGHPVNCPSVLVDTSRNAKATFMSNGSVGFEVKLDNGMDVHVLDGHYDIAEKRETGLPSSNVWISVTAGQRRFVASLMNPKVNQGCPAVRVKVVKRGDPDRSYWYCAWFKPAPGVEFVTAIKLSFTYTGQGPAVSRDILVRNLGTKRLDARLFTYFQLHGTQRFVYNKELWYDAGLPVSDTEIVTNAVVPYSDVQQLKRVSSCVSGCRAEAATCDQITFVGDTTNSAALPQAVLNGALLRGGAGPKLSRFATASIGANQFGMTLAKGGTAVVNQSLLFVTDARVIETFRALSAYAKPTYTVIAAAFRRAARAVVRGTPGPGAVWAARRGGEAGAAAHPDFEIQIPRQKVVSLYANSMWMTVKELYENCRAHGARLADGIELGTRDRGQDMWPKMKEDPGRVRRDLVYALGMMYWTTDEALDGKRGLTLPQKLHGMFPRQYPSAWQDRAKEVMCDNRPYADSPLWLIDSLMMYIRETGDASILLEETTTVRLTNPEDPIHSGIVGHSVRQTVLEAALGALHAFERLSDDSPYGMAQVMYGDWCDPVDMFGTDIVGDASRRGRGAGVQTRLTAHVFLTLVDTVDVLSASAVAALLERAGKRPDLRRLKAYAARLRANALTWAWEHDPEAKMPGFISWIHEKRKDGSVPDYARGETGYTLGSMRGRDFDGNTRRSLATQAYGARMLTVRREWLDAVPGVETILRKLLHTIDHLFRHPKLGLLLFTTPVANNAEAVRLVGRMGVVPSGCAENGEYHHGQIMMHRYRMSLPGQATAAWRSFMPMISAMRDEGISGPFETPCTSYVADTNDPHFGRAMYFGLSGSIDWMVEFFQQIAGVEFNLHDPAKPAVTVAPDLPADLGHAYTFKRNIHVSAGQGRYRVIPLTVTAVREGKGATLAGVRITINGRPADNGEVRSLEGLDALEVRYAYRLE